MNLYQEIKNLDAPMVDCFFAFSNSQYNEAITEQKLEGKKILKAPANLFGTKEGLDAFMNFYKVRTARITNECDPQEVYNYEFGNHECDYVGDDTEAINIVIHYFGKEKAKQVKRQWAHTEIV